MTQTVDGLMRLTGRSVNDPAGNPVSAEQWFYDGESNLLKMISREEQASYQYNTLYHLTGAVYEKQPGEFIPKPALTKATSTMAWATEPKQPLTRRKQRHTTTPSTADPTGKHPLRIRHQRQPDQTRQTQRR